MVVFTLQAIRVAESNTKYGTETKPEEEMQASF